MITEIARRDPQDYSRQWESTRGRGTAVKHAALLIESLSSNVPLTMQKCISLLEPHWSCTAYVMRSSLVSAWGNIFYALHNLQADEGKAQSLIQSKQRILDRLMERFKDVNAFTRYEMPLHASSIAA